MSMQVGGTSGYSADINVTPLVDVMLVLLIIFMVVTPLLQSGVTVRLPKSVNPQEERKINADTAVIVAIPEDRVWYFRRDQIKGGSSEEETLNLLTEKIKNEMKDRPIDDKVVYVKSSEDVHYGYVVKTIEAVRNAGIDRIGLVVDRDKTKAPGAESAAQ